jgi:hypothetical protein
MNLAKLFVGERTPENEGFSKSHETLFKQEVSVVHSGDEIERIRFDVDSEFFINPEQNIVYMVGNVKNRRFSIPIDAEVNQRLDEYDSTRIFAYSEWENGPAILTGNHGTEALNAVFGGVTLRVPNELFFDRIITRNVEQRDVSRVLRSHKDYVSGLKLVSNPKLAEKLAKTYEDLQNYLHRIPGFV